MYAATCVRPLSCADNPSFRDERPAYRRFLLDQSRFKKVLDIQNQALLDLIHQTFRAQYFKDVILPSVLDYETCTSLLYLIRSNCAEIIDFIESDTEYMSKLISLFWSEDEDSRWSILKFMKELLFMYKVYTNKRRPKFYEYPAAPATPAPSPVEIFSSPSFCNSSSKPSPPPTSPANHSPPSSSARSCATTRPSSESAPSAPTPGPWVPSS